jgi:hypothetical protein
LRWEVALILAEFKEIHNIHKKSPEQLNAVAKSIAEAIQHVLLSYEESNKCCGLIKGMELQADQMTQDDSVEKIAGTISTIAKKAEELYVNGRAIYLMDSLPSDLRNYKLSYIFVIKTSDPESALLFFINRKAESLPLTLTVKEDSDKNTLTSVADKIAGNLLRPLQERFELLLISSLKEGDVIQQTSLYLEKYEDKLKYLAYNFQNPQQPIEGFVDVKINDEHLTNDHLRFYRYTIFAEAFKKGHIERKVTREEMTWFWGKVRANKEHANQVIDGIYHHTPDNILLGVSASSPDCCSCNRYSLFRSSTTQKTPDSLSLDDFSTQRTVSASPSIDPPSALPQLDSASANPSTQIRENSFGENTITSHPVLNR